MASSVSRRLRSAITLESKGLSRNQARRAFLKGPVKRTAQRFDDGLGIRGFRKTDGDIERRPTIRSLKLDSDRLKPFEGWWGFFRSARNDQEHNAQNARGTDAHRKETTHRQAYGEVHKKPSTSLVSPEALEEGQNGEPRSVEEPQSRGRRAVAVREAGIGDLADEGLPQGTHEERVVPQNDGLAAIGRHGNAAIRTATEHPEGETTENENFCEIFHFF